MSYRTRLWPSFVQHATQDQCFPPHEQYMHITNTPLYGDPRYFLQPEQEAVLQTAIQGPQRDRHLQGRQQHHRKHHVLGEYGHRRGQHNRRNLYTHAL